MGKCGQPGSSALRPNYVMREMGDQVGRRHADKLRRFVSIGLFAVPAACLLVALLIGGSVGAGASWCWPSLRRSRAMVERWLFFAESRPRRRRSLYGKEAA